MLTHCGLRCYVLVSEYHGKEGPLSVIEGGLTKASQAWVDAGVELGWQEVDYNGANQEGEGNSYIIVNQQPYSCGKTYIKTTHLCISI